MPDPRRGRWAVVTGAGSGIGFATARRLATDGWEVAALDRDADGLERVVHAVHGDGGRATAWSADVTDRRGVADTLEAVQADGGIGLLVNNAGIGVAATTPETSDEDWDRLLAVDLTGVFVCCRAVLPGMLAAGGGRIVNVASVAGLVGLRNRAAYCAAKAGVIGLTRALAVDHAADGIRANAVCPGTVATEWIGKILADAPDPSTARAAMEARQLDGRMGTPEEIASAIAWLGGDEARFANGAAFVVDGGMTAT